MATYKGTGIVTAADFVEVKWTGKTKAGNACEITLTKAINKGNIDWAFAEKDDTVAQVVFTAAYSNTNSMVADDADYEEPWTIKVTGSDATESGNILLGAGIFSVGGEDVALTRGGGSFNVEREFRNINADGDRGTVEGRVVMEGSEATLTLNALQFLTKMDGLYPAISKS